jgi:hypothetical protein
MRIAAALSAAFALASCATPRDAAPLPPAPFTLALGQTYDAGGIAVTPAAILEESRCPADAMCIQAGTIRLSVQVRRGSGSKIYDVEPPRPADIGGIWLNLVSACPYPLASRPAAPSAYRFTFLLGDRVDTEHQQAGCVEQG